MTMYKSFFIFDLKYYKQCDGVPIGSPLGPTLANVFMWHFENIWLENCPTQFKSVVCIEDMWTTHFYFSFNRTCRKN